LEVVKDGVRPPLLRIGRHAGVGVDDDGEEDVDHDETLEDAEGDDDTEQAIL
jgi:hypothetical protein